MMKIDIFIIDVFPSLDSLNRIILLGVDYFVTPCKNGLVEKAWIL